MRLCQNTISRVGFSDNPMIVAVQMDATDFPVGSMYRTVVVNAITRSGVHPFHTITDNNEQVTFSVSSAFKSAFTNKPITPSDILTNFEYEDPAETGVIEVYRQYLDSAGNTITSDKLVRSVSAIRGGVSDIRRFMENAFQPSAIIARMGVLSCKPLSTEVVNNGDHVLMSSIDCDNYTTSTRCHYIRGKAGEYINIEAMHTDNIYRQTIYVGISSTGWKASENLPSDVYVRITTNGEEKRLLLNGGVRTGTFSDQLADFSFYGISPNATIVWEGDCRYVVFKSDLTDIPEGKTESAAMVLGKKIHIYVEKDGTWYASEPLLHNINIVAKEKGKEDTTAVTLSRYEYEGEIRAINLTFGNDYTWTADDVLQRNVLIEVEYPDETVRQTLPAGQMGGIINNTVVIELRKTDSRHLSWHSSAYIDDDVRITAKVHVASGETEDDGFTGYVAFDISSGTDGELSLATTKYEFDGEAIVTGTKHNYITKPAESVTARVISSGHAVQIADADASSIEYESVEIVSEIKGDTTYDIQLVDSISPVNDDHTPAYDSDIDINKEYIRRVFVEDDPNRHEFFFINSFGMLESVSALCLEKKTVKFSSAEFNRAEIPSFVPYNTHSVVTTKGRNTWAMSSGYVSDEWAAWWTDEFLSARRHWLRLSDGTILPVSIKPSENYTVYDKTKPDMIHIDFTVISGIPGNVNL